MDMQDLVLLHERVGSAWLGRGGGAGGAHPPGTVFFFFSWGGGGGVQG